MSEPTDLGVFLRARREALRPADVGLVDNGRRRTPGLRREEVAALVGVSIDYLTRIEQGRDLHPSTSVLAALAAALRLGDEERIHMAKLATLAALYASSARRRRPSPTRSPRVCATCSMTSARPRSSSDRSAT